MLRNMIQFIMSVVHGVMSVFYYIITIHLYMTGRQGEGVLKDDPRILFGIIFRYADSF